MRRKDVAFFEAQNERKERNIYNYRPEGYNKTLYEMALESYQTNLQASLSPTVASQPEMRDRAREILRNGDLGESDI